MFNGTVDWHHVDGTHTYSLNADTSPLKSFDVEQEMRIDTSRTKMMAHGLWRTRSLRGGMTIHCEGALFANDSTSYVTARKALVLALFGVPDAVIVDDYMGYLLVTPAGESEAWKAEYCTIEAFQSPVDANYPALTEFLVTFHSFNPWFVGVTSGNKYVW